MQWSVKMSSNHLIGVPFSAVAINKHICNNFTGFFHGYNINSFCVLKYVLAEQCIGRFCFLNIWILKFSPKLLTFNLAINNIMNVSRGALVRSIGRGRCVGDGAMGDILRVSAVCSELFRVWSSFWNIFLFMGFF